MCLFPSTLHKSASCFKFAFASLGHGNICINPSLGLFPWYFYARKCQRLSQRPIGDILTNSCADLNGTLTFIPVNRTLLAPPQVPAYAMLGQKAEVNFFICRAIVHVVRSKVMHIDILFVYIWVKNTHIYIYIYIQGVPGGMYQTSGRCSLC